MEIYPTNRNFQKCKKVDKKKCVELNFLKIASSGEYYVFTGKIIKYFIRVKLRKKSKLSKTCIND